MPKNLNLLGITLSPDEVSWKIDLPLYWHKTPRRHFSRLTEQWNRERLDFIAQEHTLAANEALDLYPETTHFYHVDSYYLRQTNSLKVLVMRYTKAILSDKPNIILGASIWANPGLIPLAYYYDGGCPQMLNTMYTDRPTVPKKVSSVGAVLISPVDAYKRNGFSNEGFPKKFFWNNYCKGFETYLDVAEFWRYPEDSDILDLRV